MFVKGDRVVVVRDIFGAVLEGQTGRITQSPMTNVPDMVAVRFDDGSQSGCQPSWLAYADHPDFTNTEEVEAWLST